MKKILIVDDLHPSFKIGEQINKDVWKFSAKSLGVKDFVELTNLISLKIA